MTTAAFDPLVPRPIDRPTVLALSEEPDADVADVAKILAAPDDPAEWDAWRNQLERWRTSARHRHGAATADRAGDTEWASRCFSTAIVWLWDERLFDHRRQVFTVDRWLEAAADHGGFDAIVLWHAYPIIGLDERNQFDFYRDASGLAELVADLRHHGVRVLLDYNPWDVGTRRAVHDDATMLAGLVTDLGADGVFLDTMTRGRSRPRGHAAATAPATGARRRVAGAARPHRRPPDELGAMVRRQSGARASSPPTGSSAATNSTTRADGTATTATSCSRAG